MDSLTQGYIMFGVVGAVALVTAVGMLVSRSAIYSALFLVLNLCSIAVFFLILGGPFIAVAQVSVYAGAIMVLFLFVIMLLGAEHTPGRQSLPSQPVIAVILILILLTVTGVALVRTTPALAGAAGAAQAPAVLAGSPENIGRALFSSYLLPFEVTSVMLLVALVGAIVLSRETR